MKFSTELAQQLAESWAEQVRQHVAEHPTASEAEMETELREALQQLGKECLGKSLTALDRPYPEAQRECACGGQANYYYRREGQILSVFGWVRYRRAYYVCPLCHQGYYPLDEQYHLRPGRVSGALGSLLALLGIQTAFEEASRLAEQLLLVHVSENTVLHETRCLGQLRTSEEQGWQTASQDLEHLQTRRRTVVDHPRRLYGSLDGIQIPVGPEWRELKIGCWYEVEPVRKRPRPPYLSPQRRIGDTSALRAKGLTYYCDFTEAKDFGPLAWATGYQRGADVADEIIFVADGAVWIWNLVQIHFPQAIQIVDWYHAAEYLPPIAHAAYGEQNPQAQRWLEAIRTDLWEGRVQPVIRACQEWAAHPQAGPLAHKAITYYTNNAKRMDYARFRAAGYQIGSGSVESGCKQIGTLRLKRAGARWTEAGARATAKARAAWLSHEWDTLTALRAHAPAVT